MTMPFIKLGGGFLIFSGDNTRDAMFLSRDSIFYQGDSQSLDIDDGSGIQIGDVLFLCDFLNNRSVLFRVNKNNDSNSLLVAPITEVTKDQTAFDKFYSPAQDFEGFEFLRGSRVIKLAAPIEYSVQTEGELTSLYRRASGSAWELVIPNIQNFNFTQDIQPSRVGFNISFDVLSEGIESAQIAQPVRITVNPRSLNRTFDTR